MGRATQGVKVINLKNGDEIAAAEKISLDYIENEQNARIEDLNQLENEGENIQNIEESSDSEIESEEDSNSGKEIANDEEE